jgi:hypothetical protein
MKTSAVKTFLTLSFFFGSFFASAQAKIKYGLTPKDIQNQVEQRLKDSLNPKIKFDVSLKQETEIWLDLKIQGKSTEGRIGEGKVHLFSQIQTQEDLDPDNVLSYIDLNIDRIKNGVLYYWKQSGEGVPSSFYCKTLEVDGTTYFVYAMR